MLLICFGTRPELIKLIPIINIYEKKNIEFKLLFTGQHPDLIKKFYKYINERDIIELKDIMDKNQTLNKLSSKILYKIDNIFDNLKISKVMVQGDTTTAFIVALSAFNRKIKIIHLEAGLRTNNRHSPYPEEMNRRMISQIADIHLCPTKRAVENLKKELITKNVYLVGNTIVDVFNEINSSTSTPKNLKSIIDKNLNYKLVTLHRRENRGKNIEEMWGQLNELSKRETFIYITHPSLPESKSILNERIIILEPQNYENMVHLINNSDGIITDSGGLQEEAVCANKKVLVCRDTTERPETIECGLGKLININIINNIDFFNKKLNILENPYGNNVSEKIYNILLKIN